MWLITFNNRDRDNRFYGKDKNIISQDVVNRFKNTHDLSEETEINIFSHLPDKHDLPAEQYFAVVKSTNDEERCKWIFYEITNIDMGWIRSNKKRRLRIIETVTIEKLEMLNSIEEFA